MADPHSPQAFARRDASSRLGRPDHDTFRGGWRGRPSGGQGRGRGRGRGGDASWKGGDHKVDKTRDFLEKEPHGSLIKAIGLHEVLPPITNVDVQHMKITNCEYLASYNWIDMSEPTVLFPGAPPAWTPPKTSPKLKEDAGIYFRDPNAARYPAFPTEPAVRALFASHPGFNTAGVNVVGCGSTVGNLLRFASSAERSFRLRAEMVGSTVFLVRTEISPTETIDDVRGYGHSFPEAYTTWEPTVKGSATHQRVIQYDFGGLRMLIRYEGDGYLKDKVPDDGRVTESSKHSSDDDEERFELPSLGGVAISEKEPHAQGTLKVRHADHEVPQQAMFDLKTRSDKREFDMEEIYPRLWVNQTPNFILAYHRCGVFNDIKIRNVSQEVKFWETRNARSLRALCATLKEIIRTIKQSASRKVEIRRIANGPLEIRPQTDRKWSALPEDLKEKWSGSGNPASESVESGDSNSSDEDFEDDSYLRF